MKHSDGDGDGVICLGPWVARRASETTPDDGRLLSLAGSHTPGRGDPGWLPADVPETALTMLVRNGLLPDPYKDTNLEGIPDIFHAGRDYYTFWWCTSFKTPEIRARRQERTCLASVLGHWLGDDDSDPDSDRFVHLVLDGANYRVEVYVNGCKVDVQHERGMYLRRVLSIGALVHPSPGCTNCIAIKVHPPDHLGCIDKGGQGGDHDIAKDVTAQYVEGWDWTAPVPDRNTGLWKPVRVQCTGPVVLRDPSPSYTCTGSEGAPSHVSLRVWCKNCSSSAVDVDLVGFVALSNHQATATRRTKPCAVWRRRLTLEPSKGFVEVDLGVKVLRPLLWHPMGFGEQNLYRIGASAFTGKGGRCSHEVSTTTGFRQLETTVDPHTKGRKFVVNGQPVFVRGANYIVPDLFLRSVSAERCWQEVRYHAEMGFNMIRLWGGANAPYPAFFEACDYYGVMVWSEFWITGDCNGRGSTDQSPQSNQNWPLDHALFLRCARDSVEMLRHHPSLVLWCGGNEQTPCDEIDQGLRALLRDLDPGRTYVPGSLWGGFGEGGGDWSDGPYGIQNDRDFFSKSFYQWGFNPEVGSVGVPPAESIRSMFSSSQHRSPPKYVNDKEVPNGAWNYHCYITYAASQDEASKILMYGDAPKSLDEFCTRAQIVNYTQYRSMLEAWASMMWSKYTGMLVWKTANPWSSLRGQLYDWLLNPNGGYFGAKTALEPLHVQMNLGNGNAIEVVNTTPRLWRDLTLDIESVGLDGSRDKVTSTNIEAPPNSVIKLDRKIPLPSDDGSVQFVKLLLRGERTSRNVYWLASDGSDYAALQTWGQRSRISVEARIKSITVDNGVHKVFIEIENRTPLVGFWITLKVLRGDSWLSGTCDDCVLPVHYSHNYVTLFPGEVLPVQIEYKSPADSVERPHIMVEGWNVERFAIPIHPTNKLHSRCDKS